MITPASMGDWAQAIAIGGLLLGATSWFALALREEVAPEEIAEGEADGSRELVGAGAAGAERR